MPEPDTPITFSHKELAEILVKHAGIDDGIWGLYVEFGIKGMNAGQDDDHVSPCAVVPIVKVGLQRFPRETSISVDAKKVQNKKRSSGTRGTAKKKAAR